METMTTIWQATCMGAQTAWNMLAALSSGNPGMAVVVILAGIGWFAGVGAIIGSLI